MKISVITQHTVNNYGSVLQCYATAAVLEQLGHQVEFVDYWRASNLPGSRVERMLSDNRIMQKLRPIWGCTEVTKGLARWALTQFLKHEDRYLRDYLKSRVKLTDKCYTSLEMLMEDPPAADVYVTGSDQVWNSIHNDGVDGAYFLRYAPEGKKRIALAASIGRTALDEEEIPQTVEFLRDYDAIFVREESAVTLLDSLGIEARSVLDPTLMLDGDWWRAQADYGKCPEEPYLLIYQLNKSPEMDQYAQELAKKHGWKVVRIGYFRSDKKRPEHCVYRPQVAEFLGLFDRAACCLTDSFHATAFCLNLATDFISVAPPRFETRIESILSLTGTEHRLQSRSYDLPVDEFAVDHGKVQAVLTRERQRARAFIEHAI